MKKFIFPFLFFFGIAHASNDPYKVFSQPVKTMNINLTIQIVDDPNRTCNEASQKFKLGWTLPSVACAYYTRDLKNCTVILPRNFSMQLIGHEILHCVLGDWH